MTRSEIDLLWQQAMKQAIEKGEMFTRYHFAALVAAAEREACAKVCDVEAERLGWPTERFAADNCAAAIRARGNA